MAEAKKVPADYQVVITLSSEEAKVLLTVTQSIGGDVSTSKRRYTDNISRALENIGMQSYDKEEIFVEDRDEIYMKDC